MNIFDKLRTKIEGLKHDNPMVTDSYILRADVLEVINQLEPKHGNVDELLSKGRAYDQVRWERDIAIKQLHELGYELGQKIVSSKEKEHQSEHDKNELIKQLCELLESGTVYSHYKQTIDIPFKKKDDLSFEMWKLEFPNGEEYVVKNNLLETDSLFQQLAKTAVGEATINGYIDQLRQDIQDEYSYQLSLGK